MRKAQLEGICAAALKDQADRTRSLEIVARVVAEVTWLDVEKLGMEELRKTLGERTAELDVAVQFLGKVAPTATTKRATRNKCVRIEPRKDAAGDEGGA